MNIRYLIFVSALSLFTLTGCQLRGDDGGEVRAPSVALPLTTSIVFQADLVGCKRSELLLFRQTGPTDYQPVDRLTLVRSRGRNTPQPDTFNARGSENMTHVRAMVPGKYHIRAITCGEKAPRNAFAIGSFDVVEGRAAYIGKLVVGKRDGRVLLRVENDAETAYQDIQVSHPGIVPSYGVRLLVSSVPGPA